MNSEQPTPQANEFDPVWDLVVEDMKERNRIGTERYGTPLQPWNGRDPQLDLYQELLDAAVYARQALIERPPPDMQITILRPWARIDEDSVPDRAAGIRLLQRAEKHGRVSHRSEELQTDDSYDRFLRTWAIERGDWSFVEHLTVTVNAEVDRGITHEWVRHRLGNYTQESTRFVRYTEDAKVAPRFVCPERIYEHPVARNIWGSQVKSALWAYEQLLKNGQRPQEARAVLPTCLAARIDVTYNLRMWRHFFIMRTTKEAHPQMREVTIPLLREFQEKIPVLYEDIEPEMSQREAMRLLH